MDATTRTVLLPHRDLVALLSAAGEGRATLAQLGIDSSAVLVGEDRRRGLDVPDALADAWPLGTPPWMSRLLADALTVIQQADHRVLVSGGATALIALVAADRVVGLLVGADGIRLRALTAAELTESALEILRLATSSDERWTLARWKGDQLVASAAFEKGDVTITAQEHDLRAAIDRAATIQDLVATIIRSPEPSLGVRNPRSESTDQDHQPRSRTEADHDSNDVTPGDEQGAN